MAYPPRRIAALVGGLLASLATGCTEPVRPVQSVLLVSIDTLRADHLGVYGYARDTSPAIDRLGAQGVVFEHALVQWPVTTPSMASMFSGEYPHVTGIVISASHNFLPPRLRMLPEAFQERGHRTAAVVANGVLGRRNNFDQGFERYRELWKESGEGPRTARPRAERVTDAAIEELERLEAAGEPFLLWVHYIDPHSPYDPPPGYAERFRGDGLAPQRRAPVNPDDQPWRGIPRTLYEKAGALAELGHYVDAYDGEIRYADEQVGRLVARLDAGPAAGSTLVALVSDHGESLGEHDHYMNHGHLPYDEQLRVPLLFRWPDRRHAGRRIETPVEARGLARTLLAAVGVPDADNPFPGASWLAAMAGDESTLPAEVFSLAGSEATRAKRRYTLALREGDLKLVLPRSGWARERHGGRAVELYDLARDPGERADLAPSRAEKAREMQRRLVDWFASGKAWPRRRVTGQQLDEPTRQALLELGYLQER